MFSEKASLIKNGRGHIKTISAAYPAPSIIRLDEMIKRPRPTVKLSKSEIFRRDNYTCQYCGKRTSKLTIDHVTPRHMGGSHSWDNLVAACPACNHKKGGKTPQQAHMRLLNSPHTPNTSAKYRFGHYLKVNEDWLPFVEGW
jgi:5-methylcytosine-specific restriction endonuclease McrA